MQQNQNPNKVAATEAPRRVISLLVDNHNGVLARVSSLFCRRGFNIDSLTVSATNDPAVSRITVTLHGDDAAISQLILQTERLEVTRQVFELTPDKSLQRELLLLKVACNTAERAEMREIATIYKSKIIDLSPDSMVFELTGRPEKINAFLKMFSGYDILELCRTGITALERGGKHPHMQKPPQEVRAAQLPLPGPHCPQDEEYSSLCGSTNLDLARSPFRNPRRRVEDRYVFIFTNHTNKTKEKLSWQSKSIMIPTATSACLTARPLLLSALAPRAMPIPKTWLKAA